MRVVHHTYVRRSGTDVACVWWEQHQHLELLQQVLVEDAPQATAVVTSDNSRCCVYTRAADVNVQCMAVQPKCSKTTRGLTCLLADLSLKKKW